MIEKIFEIQEVSPVDLFGVNDSKLKIIRDQFPALKLVSRGENIKAIGSQKDIDAFEKKLRLLIQHLLKFKQLTESNIERLLHDEHKELETQLSEKDEVLVFGNSGILVKARTVNQRKLVKSIYPEPNV